MYDLNPVNDLYEPGHPAFDPEGDEARSVLNSLLQSGPTAPSTVPQQSDVESGNILRPSTFEDVVGQDEVKWLLKRMVDASLRRGTPLDHVLLVGPSGTGKTTLAHVIAKALSRGDRQVRVFQLEAPISHDTLVELSREMNDGDILFLDEIHQQAISERRGKSASTQPEVLFSVMEDRTLPTGNGILPFPHITVIGATTDEGMLPDPFINRFPIRPVLQRYSEADMVRIVHANAEAMKLGLELRAAVIFARASRGVPREANNYMRNAAMLTDFRVSPDLAREVLRISGTSEDGLTRDMQNMLRFLYTRARRVNGDGEVKYQASVSTIATAIGKSRDQKAIALRVEPYLIEKGYVQVGHGGRTLTDAGIKRASRLES